MEYVTTIRGARSFLHQGYKYTLNCRNASGQIYWRCHDRSCPGRAVSEFFQYFEATWLHGAFPVRMWNVQYLDGACTNNHAEGWHSKVRKLVGKAHPNIYEAVSLFQAEQAATEISLMQLAAGGLLVRRRKYRNCDKRLQTIKEKYEVGEYTLSELLPSAYSHWVSL